MAALVSTAVSITGSLIVFAFTWGAVKTSMGDHERRIETLESQKADNLAGTVTEQGKHLSTLADIVRQDHDSIVKLATIVDEREQRAHR